jgi:hypothetical protein
MPLETQLTWRRRMHCRTADWGVGIHNPLRAHVTLRRRKSQSIIRDQPEAAGLYSLCPISILSYVRLVEASPARLQGVNFFCSPQITACDGRSGGKQKLDTSGHPSHNLDVNTPLTRLVCGGVNTVLHHPIPKGGRDGHEPTTIRHFADSSVLWRTAPTPDLLCRDGKLRVDLIVR